MYDMGALGVSAFLWQQGEGLHQLANATASLNWASLCRTLQGARALGGCQKAHPIYPCYCPH